MTLPTRGALSIVGLLLIALAVPARADLSFSRADADSLQRKIGTILEGSAYTSRTSAARSRQTPILEREVNAYLRFHLRDQVPAGITDPTISIIGAGRLSGQAIVDLDAVGQSQRSGAWLDPSRLLGGRLPVTVTGVLATRNGVGRFTLESAEVSGVPIPQTVLQQLISYYSRTPDDPDGVSLDEAFELPARIREIRVERGQAVVVQ